MRIILFVLCTAILSFSCKDKKAKEITQVKINDSSWFYYDSLVSYAESYGMLVPAYLKRLNGKYDYSFSENVKYHFRQQNASIIRYDLEIHGFRERINELPLDSYLNSTNDEIYRLVIDRHFSRTKHVFRLEFHFDTSTKKSSQWMIVKTCDGYYPDSLIKEEKIQITESQWKTFKSKIEYADFWALGEDGISGIDGTFWHMSGLKYIYGSPDDRVYRTVVRWVPEKTAFRDAAIYLVELYDKKLAEKYIAF